MARWADWIVVGLTVLGLLLTVWGAWKAASAIIIDENTASTLAGTYWGGNSALKQALLDQSRAAQLGLYLVAVGSVMQVFAVVLQFVVAQK